MLAYYYHCLGGRGGGGGGEGLRCFTDDWPDQSKSASTAPLIVVLGTLVEGRDHC